MARTPDPLQGTLDLPDLGEDPTEVGQIGRNGTDIKAVDGSGVFNLRSGAGLTEAQHRILRQLIHFIDDGPAEGFASGAYCETSWSGPFPTLEVWWESSSKLKKIVEHSMGWTGANLTSEAWSVYATDGVTVIGQVSDAITYSGLFEQTRTRTITVS